MTHTGFIAVIDLGTSKITGIVGRKDDDNIITVLAYETIASDNCIRRGLVYNIEETGSNVRKLITKLENKLNSKISKVYVSIAGQSLHAVTHTVNKQLSSSGIVTDSVVEQIRKEAEKFMPEMSKRYDVAEVEYIINGKAEPQPVGVSTTHIQANYQMIVGRPNIMTNIEKSIKGKANLEIADFVVGPLASGAISLNENEKELGCAFIDFGAGTSSLSIYKGGKLRYMVVIPFGGDTITRDICDLNYIKSDAEKYKIKYGKACENNDKEDYNSSSSKPNIDVSKIDHVIKMRLQEIVDNIGEQIKLSGYQDRLGAGLVITGGASQLRNLIPFLENRFKMTVRSASAKKTLVKNYPELANDPSFTQALGLLLSGKDNCEVEVVIVPETVTVEPQPPKELKKKPIKNPKPEGTFKNRLGNMLGRLFEDGNDGSEDDDDN